MDLSLLLRSTLGGMTKVLGDCGFNLVFHSSSEKKTTKQIHWHVEVYPRRLELGGTRAWRTGSSSTRSLPRRPRRSSGAASRKELAQMVGIT